MVSALSNRYLYMGFKWSHYLFSSPFQWDSKTNYFYCTKSLWRMLAWYLHILILVAYNAFIVFRLISLAQTGESKEEAPVVYVFGGLNTLAICFQVTLLRSAEDYPVVIKSLMKYTEDFYEEYGKVDAKKEAKKSWIYDDFCSNILYNLCICSVVNPTTGAFSPYFYPNVPYSFTSMVADPENLSIIYYVLQTIFFQYLFISWCSVFNMIMFPCLAHLHYGLEVLAELRFGQDTYKTENYLRTEAQAVQVYHEFQVLQKRAFSFFNALALPSLQYMFMLCAVTSLYGAIVMEGIMRILCVGVAFASLMDLSVFFTLLGYYDSMSSDVLASWKYEARSPWFQKIMASLNPIRINIGELYYADAGLVLTMMGIILENTVSLLMAR